MIFIPPSPSLAETMAQGGIDNELLKASNQRRRITRLRQKTGLAVDDNFRHPTSATANHGFSEHHRLDENESEELE